MYSSLRLAKEAQQRSCLLPGFLDWPDGFEIDRYEIDKDHWTEGFTALRS